MFCFKPMSAPSPHYKSHPPAPCTPPAGDLAQRCFDSARSVEPSLVAVWEAQGYLASGSQRQQREAFDSFEHAVGLGGGLESRLGFASGGCACCHL
jgi:hypothetical protein